MMVPQWRWKKDVKGTDTLVDEEEEVVLVDSRAGVVSGQTIPVAVEILGAELDEI